MTHLEDLRPEASIRGIVPDAVVVEQGRPWSFDGDGGQFRLVSEANRIRLAHLFDPVLAVHTSLVEPLPHQITTVYEEMLGRNTCSTWTHCSADRSFSRFGMTGRNSYPSV